MLATRSHVQSPVCVHLQDHVLANEHKARQVHVSQSDCGEYTLASNRLNAIKQPNERLIVCKI